MHTAQLDKRGHKFEIAADALCGLEPPLGCVTYGVPEEEAEVGVLAWGSTAGVVREAVEEMAAEGYPVAALVPAVINPLPADRILDFAQRSESRHRARGEPHRPVRRLGQGPHRTAPDLAEQVRRPALHARRRSGPRCWSSWRRSQPSPAAKAEPVEEVAHG